MAAHSDNTSLFHTPPRDDLVQGMEWIEYRPVGQLNSEGALEFNVSGNGARYMDLMNTRLKVKFRILQADGQVIPPAIIEGKPTPDAAKVGPVNLFLQSLWRQVDVSVQQQLVSPNIGTHYAYKAYMETLLNYGRDAKESQLQASLYMKDQGDVKSNDPVSGTNSGLILRSIYTEQSKVVDLEGSIYIDICQQNRYMLNGVEVGFKFWPTSTPFKLMSANPAANYKIDIQEALLKVCFVEMTPNALLAHSKVLQQQPAKYFYDKTEMKSFAVAKGAFGCTLEDVFQGIVPKKLVVGMVASEAFMGDYKRNPFEFKHMDCQFIGFYVDGKSTPMEALTPNYANNNYLSAYMTTFGVDGYQTNFGHDISREDYAKGFCLYVFDVCLNHCEKTDPKGKRGRTRLEIKFAKGLPEPATVIVLAKFPGLMEIDGSRAIKIY